MYLRNLATAIVAMSIGCLSHIGVIADEILTATWQNGHPPIQEQLTQIWNLNPRRILSRRWDEPGVLQLRPDSINEEAWSAIVTNLHTAVGSTLGDWVRVLGADASYLARSGQPNLNIDDLWRFEVLKASGLGPVPVLDAVTDASMITPGVGLSISRAFPNSIPARYVQGPFGYGWTFNWNLKLAEETNGLVQIGSCCGGTQRRYEPDTRTPGKYFSMPGDTATLTKLGNGTFELRSPDGTITRFAANGNLDAIEDANGNRISAAYDGLNRLQTLTHTSGASLTIGYNAAGHISTISDSAGRTNRFTYDASGNYLTAVGTSDGKITSYTYQTTGDARSLHALTSIDRGGTTQYFTYDTRGRLASTYRAAGEQLIQFNYDSDGTVFVIDSLGTNQLFYNESGLLTKVVDPLGNITSSEFDSDFRLKRLILPTGENQTFVWSDSGNLTRLIDEAGNSTSFAYVPGFNRLASFTDAKANTTRYTYDSHGNLLSTTYPDNSVEQFADYDSTGMPLSYTNRRGQPLTYEYNSAGQITNQIFADGHSIQFTYDSRGNLGSTIDGEKVTTYAYAPANDGDRLKRVTYPNGRFLDYTYDSFGRRIQMTDQDGFATKYEYDSAGRLWKLRDETDTLLVTYTYDPSGRLSRIDKGNGTFTTYEYDRAGQLLSLKNHRNATTLNSRFDYTYDRRGRRTSMSTFDGDWTYGYDATGQLTRAVFASVNTNIPNQDLTYEYDALGNRVRTIENGVTNLYVANNLNQYNSVAGTNHQYDADGNLTFDGVNTYEWDQQSRLVRVTGPSGVTEYEYDAFGNRIGRISNGGRAEFLFDATGFGKLIAESDGSGSVVARYIYGMGLALGSSGVGGRSFYDFDVLGNTVALTDTAGFQTNRYVISPFGGKLLNIQSTSNPFQFAGQFGVVEENDGLQLMRARMFNTASGSFLSADPLRFRGGSANLYSYARNSPVNLIDPFGLCPNDSPEVPVAFFEYWASLYEPGSISQAYFDSLNSKNPWVFIPAVVEAPFWIPFVTGVDTIKDAPINIYKHFISSTGTGSANATGQASPPASLAEIEGLLGGAGGACYPPPDSPPPNLPPNDETETETSQSVDPNEKRGPMGFGPANFLALGASLPYRIKFENFGPGSMGANGAPLPSQVWASAPAQEVEITDALSPELDWSTLRFTGFGFGDTLRTLEPPRSFLQTILPVTINGRSFEVHFEASLDLATGRVRVVFRSIDPQSALPPDVLTGFLPPEDGTGIGQGFIEYTVEPRADLPTGTQIRNVALISFDHQPAIATDQIDPLNPSAGNDPTKQALITIDAGAPSSSIAALPAESGRSFVFQWSGEDDANGSGIAGYDLFISTNGGPFTEWFSAAEAGATLFQGEPGETYAFYSIAHDYVGNVEPVSPAPDAFTLVISNAPQLTSISDVTVQPGNNWSVTNMVQGMPQGSWAFSLGSSPVGMSINSSNGIIDWTPDCSQGDTTNNINVWVTDR